MATAVNSRFPANPLAGLINEHNYMFWATAPIILGLFVVVLDTSIVNVALTPMMNAFGSNVEEIEWVSTGYMLSSAIMMPTTGWLGDRFGRKKLYGLAIFFFTIASMLCGAAWDTGSLIFFRILQGVFGGAIQPVAMAILYEAYPPEKRGMAMGIMGLGVMFAPMVGPTLGGYLVDYLNWRWIFYINLPFGLIATALTFWILRENKLSRLPFDGWGFGMMALFVSTLLLATSQGNSKGWDSNYIIGLFVVAAVSFGAFLVIELWRRNPVLDLRLFRFPAYTAGTIVSVVIGVGLFGGVFLLPVFLQSIMGYDAIHTGLLMMPQGLALAAVSPFAGVIQRYLHPRIPICVGLALLSASLLLQAGMTAETTWQSIAFWTVLRGLGMGMAFPAMNQASLASVPMDKIGQASGMFNLTRQIGGSFGIAALSTLLTQRSVFHMSILGQGAEATGAAGPVIGAMTQQFITQGANPALAQQQAGAVFGMWAGQQASVWAFQDAFWAAGIFVLLGLIPALMMPKPPARGGAAAAAHVAVE